MKIALTGATGFLGRYIVRHLTEEGYAIRAWYRPESKAKCFGNCEWIPGELGAQDSAEDLVKGCEALVHAALWRYSDDWSGAGNLPAFLERNLIGSIQLIELARLSGIKKFIFISSCAVHNKILGDRPLDETHPLYPSSHYGAYKAATEAFIHSFALGYDFDICSLRPTGIYGLAEPVQDSKWYDLVKSVVASQTVECNRGGKEVHAHDVARAVGLLLKSSQTKGQVYNCYDRYVSEFEVAELAKKISGSTAQIKGQKTNPKNQIDTSRLRAIGMTFGGEELLRKTVSELIESSTLHFS